MALLRIEWASGLRGNPRGTRPQAHDIYLEPASHIFEYYMLFYSMICGLRRRASKLSLPTGPLYILISMLISPVSGHHPRCKVKMADLTGSLLVRCLLTQSFVFIEPRAGT